MYVRIIALQLCLPASAAIVGGTASLLASARFPQKKVLEDELAIAGRSGAPQAWQFKSRSTVSGPASALIK